jgi:hypothetical protein
VFPAEMPDISQPTRTRHAGVNAGGPLWLQGNRRRFHAFIRVETEKEDMMRSILLWLIGIPIPIIILLYLFGVF